MAEGPDQLGRGLVACYDNFFALTGRAVERELGVSLSPSPNASFGVVVLEANAYVPSRSRQSHVNKNRG